jgi:hypothetical protein
MDYERSASSMQLIKPSTTILTLFIAHSLFSLSFVADCNIRDTHFKHEQQNNNQMIPGAHAPISIAHYFKIEYVL